MLQLRKITALTLGICLAAACNTDPPSHQPLRNDGAAAAHWFVAHQATSLSDLYKSRPWRIRARDDGGTSVLFSEGRGPRDFKPAFALRHQHPDGSATKFILNPSWTPFDFVVDSASLEVTLLAFESTNPNSTDGRLLLARCDASGRVMEEASIRVEDHLGTPASHYAIDDNTKEITSKPIDHAQAVACFNYGWQSGRAYHRIERNPRDGALYVVHNHNGVNVMRIGQHLAPVWSTQVIPSHNYSGRDTPRFTFDAKGDIWVGSQLSWLDKSIYTSHFGAELEMPSYTDYSVITKLDAQSGQRGAVVAAEGLLGGISPLGEAIFVATSQRNKKYDTANKTLEWDIAVTRIDAATGEPTLAKTLSFANEDKVLDMTTVNQTLLLAGITGGEQVDTNSWVKESAGMLLVLSADLEVLSQQPLHGPRDVRVQYVTAGPAGVAFAGTYDGPLTHTCDDDPDERRQCYSRTFVTLQHPL